jgi:hypothetical protein
MMRIITVALLPKCESAIVSMVVQICTCLEFISDYVTLSIY